MSQLKDFLGQDLNVGDIVTYPVRQGSSMWMSIGKITSIEEKRRHYSNDVYFVPHIITISEKFIYEESKYDLNSKQRKFVLSEVEKGYIPNNWKICYVNSPKKSFLTETKRIIKVNPEHLSDVQYFVLVKEQMCIDRLKLDDGK